MVKTKILSLTMVLIILLSIMPLSAEAQRLPCCEKGQKFFSISGKADVSRYLSSGDLRRVMSDYKLWSLGEDRGTIEYELTVDCEKPYDHVILKILKPGISKFTGDYHARLVAALALHIVEETNFGKAKGPKWGNKILDRLKKIIKDEKVEYDPRMPGTHTAKWRNGKIIISSIGSWELIHAIFHETLHDFYPDESSAQEEVQAHLLENVVDFYLKQKYFPDCFPNYKCANFTKFLLTPLALKYKGQYITSYVNDKYVLKNDLKWKEDNEFEFPGNKFPGLYYDKYEEQAKIRRLPDPNLEAVIRDTLNRPEGPIYTSDLESLTELLAGGRGISDLTGLEYCKNLTELDLWDNEISDISPLSNLLRLQRLNLRDNRIADISALSGLTDLRVLYLDNNEISDISALSGLTKLGAVEHEKWTEEREGIRIRLGLSNNRIEDISPLVQNEGLSESDGIDLRGNPLSETSLNTYIPQLEQRGVQVLYNIPGDVNHDGKVDAADLAMVAAAFNTKPGMPNWNPAADLNQDGTVDLFDLVVVGRNFGKSQKIPEFQIKSGFIEQDEVWSGQILITETVEVLKGATLTIEPGTVVKFKHYRHGYTEPSERVGLVIEGKLVAVGTSEKPIWFTSDADEPMNGDWDKITFWYAEDGSIIKYAIVEFAMNNNVQIWHSNPTISHTIIRWSNNEGIYMESYSSPVIEYCMIYQNANNGIAMEQFNEEVIVRYNKIFQNGQSGVHVQTSSAMIEHNVITENHNGISIMDNGSANIRYNTIEGNRFAGVFFETNKPSANTQFNTIENNSVAIGGMEFYPLKLNFNNILNKGEVEIDIEEDARGEIDASNNWWGTVDEQVIKERIYFVPHVTINYLPYLREVVSRNFETGEEITSEILFDYEDLRPYDLGYTPGDREKDKFPWVLPDDETRWIVKRLECPPSGQGFPWSLTWANGYLWVANDLGVFKLDPETGKVIASFDPPGTRPWGMTFDGKHLWINDFTELRVYEVNPENGEVISSFSYGERYPGGLNGLAWDGEYLYLTSWSEYRALVKFDRKGNFIEQIDTEEWVGGGLTFDGKYFWAQTCAGKIYRLDKEGKITGWISSGSSQTMMDLAWDGQYLWSGERTNEMWDDEKIFKLEILKVVPR